MKKAATNESGKFRYLAVAEMLQKEIEEGKYQIGERLPSERTMSHQIQASHITIRQGIDLLVRQGLVRRVPGSGTYVNAIKASPIVGILFGPSLVAESSHSYRALLAALESEIARTPYICRSYDGFNRTEATQPEDSPPYQQLMRDTQNHPVKGYIQVSMTDPEWNQLEVLKNVPRATMGEVHRDVLMDFSDFSRRSLEFVLGNERARVVYLRSFLNPQGDLEGLEAAAQKFNAPMPEVVQIVSAESDGYSLDLVAHDLVGKMAKNWKKSGSYPDALIVTDDIATRGAAIALIKAGIKVPEDLILVTLANEGIDHHYGVDVIRYAFSPIKIAAQLIAILERRLRGKEAEVPKILRGDWAANGSEVLRPAFAKAKPELSNSQT